ncbi:MAG: hypothetical protein JO266_10805, partial [Acidobacteria bacterium]|nr:hypothetical protein [Acidobacteriota bacterium]
MAQEGAAGAAVYELPQQQSNAGRWILWILAVAYLAASLYLILDYRGRLEKLEKSQTISNAQIATLQKRVAEAQTSADAIASQMGLTKKQLAQKTAELRLQQRAAESRLAK